MSYNQPLFEKRPKPKIAILSIYPFDRGGVLSMLKSAYKFCQEHFEPRVFFLGFDPKISANLRSFKFTSETRYGVKENMDYVEIGSRWAFWHPRHYLSTLNDWHYQLEDYSYFFVVSGTVFPAHPLVLLNKKFVIWAASTYEEDRKQRIEEELKGMRFLIDSFAKPKMHEIEKKILQKASFIMPLSNYTKQTFNEILGYEKLAMEISGFPIKQLTSILPYNERDEQIIITVGRFDDPRKNIDMVFRVFDKINQTMPNTKLYIVGKQPSYCKIAEYESLPSFKNIIMTGRVSDEALDRLYQQSSLMLFCSYQEGLGIVALDALARGVPVVSTNSGGPSDYIKNGRTGYIVDINDDEMMYAKAIRILQNKTLAFFISRNGQSLIREKFSEKRICQVFIQAFSNTYLELRSMFKNYNFKKNIEDEQFLQ